MKMKRKSLIYAERDTDSFQFMNAANDHGKSVKRTNIWRVGSAIGSVFLDMTDRPEDKIELLQVIAEQYPSRIGVLTHVFGNSKVAEINFDIEDSAHKRIVEEGIVFADKSIAIPCRACENGVSIAHLKLSNLPFMQEKALSEGLGKSLAPYGEVLDVGMLVESISKTYMCTGYAILETTLKADAYKDLTHAIKWSGSGTRKDFYAVWSDMGEYCQYCHSEEHTINDCPDVDDDTFISFDDDVIDEDGFADYVEFTRKKKREFINLEVVTQEGNSTTIKIKRMTPLYKLMQAYCKQHQKPPKNMCFVYNGQVLLHNKTPDDMNMREGDKIDFLENQRRGG
ncbi:hypothetical protein K501DRAFT_284871 [Backusella circina FSU 941]|nr:hypothetical protein K501DRAFT_284871 [Backusella circina FSU 941]